MARKIKLRTDLHNVWEDVNPVLGGGELGVVKDKNTIKVGDGNTNFNDLPELAKDTEVVHKTGDETIDGVKTFTDDIKIRKDGEKNIEFRNADGSDPISITRPDGTTDIGYYNGGYKFYIKGDTGNVGINITNPSEKLEVDGNIKIGGNISNQHLIDGAKTTGYFIKGENTLQIIAEDSGGIASGICLTNAPTDGDNKHWTIAQLGPDRGNRLSIGYGTSSDTGFDSYKILLNSKFTITTSGNVGIGTTNPGAKIHVASASSDTPVAIFDTNSGNSKFHIAREGSTGESMAIHVDDGKTHFNFIQDEDGNSNYGGFTMVTTVNGTETHLITGNGYGKVGIGTTTPWSKLTVNGGDVEVTDDDKGVILKNPNGDRYRVTVNNDGNLTTTKL